MLRPLRLVILALVLSGLASTSLAGDSSFKIIVNPDNPATEIDRDFLRDAYLKKVTEWPDGETIHPIDLDAKNAARDQFTEHVLRKTPAQLKTYWNQQIFSGKGVPPPEAESPADAVAFVLANRGAVAYVPADFDSGRAKVIGIR